MEFIIAFLGLAGFVCVVLGSGLITIRLKPKITDIRIPHGTWNRVLDSAQVSRIYRESLKQKETKR